MVMMHVWFIGLLEHFGEIAGKNNVRPFSPLRDFLFSWNSRERFWGLIFCIFLDWEGSTSWAHIPLPLHSGGEVLNVGGWVTHGDLALAAGIDFLAVVEHRLIPARVRSEWSRLRVKGLSSVWAPASQDSSLSLRGAPFALPTFATAQSKRFFDCGRVVRCMLPIGLGRFMHLVGPLRFPRC